MKDSLLKRTKKLILGRRRPSSALGHERLSNPVALAVFASDNLSSCAYATEEMLLVLAIGGAAALNAALPLTLGIVGVLVLIGISYRATIQAYPDGGGAYTVTSENLGKLPGLLAAASLLIDYTLTVSVSVAAGVAAVASAFEGAADHKVIIAISIVALITILNLRGVKEAGSIFAVPTYAFVLLMGATVVLGLFKVVTGQPLPPPDPVVAASMGPGIVLLARAFSHGCAAVTGIEAISNGVPAFKEPAARNAATTMAWMAGILVTLFAGISFLANSFGIAGPLHEPERTVVARIALIVFGNGPLFIAVQAATALILFLAANTSYADFPRLAAALARDRFAPRQLLNRGDKLAYSNGIVVLALAASALLYVFGAEVSRLINLYVVGVFTSLSLSQFGMVRHWIREPEPGSRARMIGNIVGGTATVIVLVIVLSTKFLDGAWMVVSAIPILIFTMLRVEAHYANVKQQLRSPATAPHRLAKNHVVMLVGDPSDEENHALRYAKMLHTADLRALHYGVDPEAEAKWAAIAGPAPVLQMIRRQTGFVRDIRRAVAGIRKAAPKIDHVTVVIGSWALRGNRGLIAARRMLLLKAALLGLDGVRTTEVQLTRGRAPGFGSGEHVAVVLVSALHNGTRRAMAYANSLDARVVPVHVALDDETAVAVKSDWDSSEYAQPLTVLESEYRELAAPILQYCDEILKSGAGVVTVVVPEFIVSHWWHQILHAQSALQLKRALLFEPRVAVTSVPVRLR